MNKLRATKGSTYLASGGLPPSLPPGLPARPSRPGQLPPKKSSSGCSNISSSSKRPRQGPREGEHAEDAARKHAAWSAARPSMQESHMTFTQHRALLRHEQMQLELSTRQQQLSGAWQLHSCCEHVGQEESEPGHCCSMELPPSLELLEERPARYMSLRAIGSVSIPRWRCSQCNLSFTPDFLAYDMFPGTPSCPETLYHMEVLEDYEHLGLRCGVSSGKYMERFTKLVGLLNCDSAGNPIDLAFKTPSETSFIDTFCNYLAVKDQAASLQNLGAAVSQAGDPLCDCPICAATPGAPECHIAVSADAVTKVGHFGNMAQSTKDLPPNLSTHFGSVHATIHELSRAGKCNLQSILGGEADSSATSACATNVDCSRPDSKAAGGVDVYGVMGKVCMHDIPVNGSFTDMPSPEQWVYYLVGFEALLRARPDISDGYVDFACKLAITWQRFLDQRPELKLTAHNFRLLVPWMHGSSHGIDCQLKNMAQYMPGTGRRIGENTEQLWSLLKVISGLVRYMRHDHRRDFIDACLSAIKSEKIPGIPSLLDKRHKATVDLHREFQQLLDTQISGAAADGVCDVEQAIQVYVDEVSPDDFAAAGDQEKRVCMQYAELLLNFWGAEAVAHNRSAMAAVSAAPTAILMEKGRLDKLRKDLNKFEDRHNFWPGEWTRDHPDFKTAFKQLVESKLYRYKLLVEQVVVELRALYFKRTQLGPACKESKSLQNRYKRKRTKLSELLGEMEVWGFKVADEDVRKFLREGVAPWLETSTSDTQSLHHGRVLHHTIHNIARCAEELEFSAQEKARLSHWITVSTRVINEALASTPCPGKQFWLRKWLLTVQSMANELARFNW